MAVLEVAAGSDKCSAAVERADADVSDRCMLKSGKEIFQIFQTFGENYFI